MVFIFFHQFRASCSTSFVFTREKGCVLLPVTLDPDFTFRDIRGLLPLLVFNVHAPCWKTERGWKKINNLKRNPVIKTSLWSQSTVKFQHSFVVNPTFSTAAIPLSSCFSRRLYPVCLLFLSLSPSSSLFSAARTRPEDADVVLMRAIERVRLHAHRNTNSSSGGIFACKRAPWSPLI